MEVLERDGAGDNAEDVLADVLVAIEAVHEGIMDHGDAAFDGDEFVFFFGQDAVTGDGEFEEIVIATPQLEQFAAIGIAALDKGVYHG
jgi:hypothetical protein